MLKIGSIVKTTKGDRLNAHATEEKLKIISFCNGWNHEPSAVCRKPNGKQSRFLLKNLTNKL